MLVGDALNPFASVSGSLGLFCTLKLFESGACWSIFVRDLLIRRRCCSRYRSWR